MRLFDEWAARFARGERPDLREYLARAGDGQEEVARLAEAWLARTEPPEPDEEAIALAQAWIEGAPPIVALRARRGLRRGEVVDALIERFGLDRAKREKVRRYYHEVETGQLVPGDERLVAALADILRTRVSDLLALRPRPLAAEPAYYRALATDALTRPPAAPEDALDEIDRLFRPAR